MALDSAQTEILVICPILGIAVTRRIRPCPIRTRRLVWATATNKSSQNYQTNELIHCRPLSILGYRLYILPRTY